MPAVTTPEHPGLDEDRSYVKQNIGEHFAKIKEGAVAKLHSNRGISKAATKFLKDSDLYDTEGRRWVGFTQSMARDELRVAIIKVLTAIYLNVAPKGQHKSRRIVDTHNMPLPHSQKHDGQGNIVHSSPDVVITGEVRDGRSFEMPSSGDVGYENAVICIEIVPTSRSKAWTLKTAIAQMGAFARYALKSFIP